MDRIVNPASHGTFNWSELARESNMTKLLLRLAVLPVILASCATYESTVASRSVAGYAKAGEDRVGGGVAYTVTYR